MKKLLLIVVAMLVIAAPAYAQASWTDGFDYPDGMLYWSGGGHGIWTAGTQTTQINVAGGAVHVTGGADDRYVRGTFATAFTSNIIECVAEINRTTPILSGPDGDWQDGWMFALKYSDSNGKMLAQWRGASTALRGAIATASSYGTMNLGWNTLKVRINLADNNAEYFLNGTSLGTVASEAGALDQLATITISKGLDARTATYNDAIFDNFSVTAVPEPGSIVAMCSGLIGMVGFARRRRA